jgi:hypothetical protein
MSEPSTTADENADADGDADADKTGADKAADPASADAAATADSAPAPAPPSDTAAREQAPRQWMAQGSRSRRLILGFGVYLACLVVYAIIAGPRLWVHSPYNHFALQAEAWLHGRQDLGGPPPAYAGNNDFALFEHKWFISFPPLPAMLMVPLVALAGSADNFRDAQFVIWLAGIGPAALFLVLEKLRRTGRSLRSEVENVQLALLFAFGTVYFFSAVQGTVWFAGHVVGVGLAALFVLASLDAEHPVLAGALLGGMFLTRPTTAFTGVFFLFEAVRAAYMRPTQGPERELPTGGSLVERIEQVWDELDRGKLFRIAIACAIPVACALLFASWLNNARFHDPNPSAFGHEFLTVGWQARIKRWGLFSWHYMPRNLGVMLASLPWRAAPAEKLVGGVPFLISGHGLALWFTTPIYLWIVWPKRKTFAYAAAGFAALGPLVMNLFYQNSGWFQFGYRFSNDYAIFLFVMLAVSHVKASRAFWVAAALSVAWGIFGAATFPGWDEGAGRGGAFYSHDPSAYFQQENP